MLRRPAPAIRTTRRQALRHRQAQLRAVAVKAVKAAKLGKVAEGKVARRAARTALLLSNVNTIRASRIWELAKRTTIALAIPIAMSMANASRTECHQA